ncbi:unnamed protein product, partial [Closterium sp. Naga37s-1]
KAQPKSNTEEGESPSPSHQPLCVSSVRCRAVQRVRKAEQHRAMPCKSGTEEGASPNLCRQSVCMSSAGQGTPGKSRAGKSVAVLCRTVHCGEEGEEGNTPIVEEMGQKHPLMDG